ncbi:MAG: hypothetical protein ACE5R3_01185 [Nitrosopumilaceae archaeon]
MRNESCRKCGTELETIKSCQFCDKPIQYHCNKCDYDTDEQTHLNCFKESFEKEVEKLPHTK